MFPQSLNQSKQNKNCRHSGYIIEHGTTDARGLCTTASPKWNLRVLTEPRGLWSHLHSCIDQTQSLAMKARHTDYKAISLSVTKFLHLERPQKCDTFPRRGLGSAQGLRPSGTIRFCLFEAKRLSEEGPSILGYNSERDRSRVSMSVHRHRGCHQDITFWSGFVCKYGNI